MLPWVTSILHPYLQFRDHDFALRPHISHLFPHFVQFLSLHRRARPLRLLLGLNLALLNDEIAILHLEEVDPPHRQDTVTMTKMSDLQMTGHFNPDNSNATRRRVHMSMLAERYHKVGDKIPKKAEKLKVLKVIIL